MQRILLTALTLAVMVYALVLGVKWLSPRIEQDLTGRITTELAKAGQLWVQPVVEGREVTLTGEAPSMEAKAAARVAVSRVFGIAKVNDTITLPGQIVSNGLVISATELVTAPALSRAERRAVLNRENGYKLTISKDAKTLTLAGQVPDESARALLLTLAATHYPELSVEATSLTVVAEGAPAGWRSAAGTVLFNLANMEQAEATLMGREVMVSGTVLSADFAEAAETAMRSAMPTLYQVAFAVDAAAPLTDMATTTDAPVDVATTSSPTVSLTVVNLLEAMSPTAVTLPVAKAPTEDQLAAVLNAIEPSAGPAMAAGCDGLTSLNQEVLRFAFNSAKVRGAEQPTLTRVAGTIKGCTTAKVEVQGYTDKTGSATYNQWLSQQRAEAALRALVREGVAREALTAKGYGETNRFGNQATVKSRAENRRVEFTPHAGR